MKNAPRDAAGEVIDLLVTWGATARSGTADLLAVLSEVGRADGRALVRTILETPGLTLPGDLQQEAAALASGESVGGAAETESRAEALLPRLEEAVRAGVVAQRNAIREELRSWGQLLDRGELDRILAEIWSHETAEELTDFVSAARRLEQARGLLGKARWRIDDELRRKLEATASTARDPDVVTRVREALDSGDPRRVRSARLEMAGWTDAREEAREAEDLDAARRHLAELCDRARGIVEDPSAAPDETVRDLLRLAIERAAPLSSGEQADARSDGYPSLLQRIAVWAQALERIVEGLAEAAARPGPAPSDLAQRVAEGIRAASREGDDEDGALAAAGESLAFAAAQGGRPFLEAFAAAAEALAERREQRRRRFETASAELRNAARELEADLERLAPVLATDRVVRARLLVERADEAMALGEPEDVEALAPEVRTEIDALRELSELSRRHQQSRLAGERKRLRSEAHQLARIAGGRSAKRVESLVERIDQADTKTLKRCSRELDALEVTLANRVRLRAARLLRRVGETDDERIGRLRSAFDEDDLPSMAELGAQLGAERARSRLPLRIGVSAMAVVLVVAVVWVAYWLRNRPHSYRLELAGDGAGTATILLVRDGTAVAESFESRPGEAVAVRLAPGSYRVFVNERYTGRVIHAPDPPFEVTDIPVLPPLTAEVSP
jgi:hypothetical protein